MGGFEENSRNIAWWWERFDLGEDWNSMPVGMRKKLVKKLHQAFIDIKKHNIGEGDILELIRLTDPPTVWDAMLSVNLPKSKSRRDVLAYLNAVVINTWKAQHPIVLKKTWQQPIKDVKKRKPASMATVDKWSSLSLGLRSCEYCGKSLRKDNETGYCRECQRQRNGKCGKC